MTHYSQLAAVALDVPESDHDRELAFWQAASGRPLAREENHPEYHGAHWPGHDQLLLLVQRLGDGQARVHLDIRSDDVEAEVARLEQLGARRVQQIGYWWVLQDPAGLPFCVVPARPGSLSDDNAQRWD
jgi:Glyoxalase-like domain